MLTGTCNSNLTQLYYCIGAVTDGEVEMSTALPLEESAVVNYTGAADFYEQVIYKVFNDVLITMLLPTTSELVNTSY